MFQLICALILVLLIATPSLGQQSLVGTYKLISIVVEVDGTPSQHMGKAPQGYLVLTPTRYITFMTADNRKFGTSVADKAALFDTLSGIAGVYRVEGDKMLLTIEVAFLEREKGTTRVETLELSGNRLALKAGPILSPEIHQKR